MHIQRLSYLPRESRRVLASVIQTSLFSQSPKTSCYRTVTGREQVIHFTEHHTHPSYCTKLYSFKESKWQKSKHQEQNRLIILLQFSALTEGHNNRRSYLWDPWQWGEVCGWGVRPESVLHETRHHSGCHLGRCLGRTIKMHPANKDKPIVIYLSETIKLKWPKMPQFIQKRGKRYCHQEGGEKSTNRGSIKTSNLKVLIMNHYHDYHECSIWLSL